MGEAFSTFRERGIRRIAFGDVFLEDVREYRMRQLAAADLERLFPLWQRPTDQLAQSFVEAGFRAFTVCIDPDAPGSAPTPSRSASPGSRR